VRLDRLRSQAAPATALRGNTVPQQVRSRSRKPTFQPLDGEVHQFGAIEQGRRGCAHATLMPSPAGEIRASDLLEVILWE
jgi:hypothetical protein